MPLTLALLMLLGSPRPPPETAPSPGAMIEVELLEKLRPREAIAIEPSGERHPMDATSRGSWSLPENDWTLALPNGANRHYRAALRVDTREGRLTFHASMPLEEYVARVVATEALPGTSDQALRALAVVVRSYALALPPRHGDAAVCDLAHCQALRGDLGGERLTRARRAARATRGEILRLPSGAIARAVFTGACGGHTGDPRELFGGREETGARAVPDPGCDAPWRAALTREQFAHAYAQAFSHNAPPDLRSRSLRLQFGQGGFLRSVTDPEHRLQASGDRFARALDAETQFRGVRSGRLALLDTPSGVSIQGNGLGHGVGLCQRGAERMAARGVGYRAILQHFFPAARIGSFPPPVIGGDSMKAGTGQSHQGEVARRYRTK